MKQYSSDFRSVSLLIVRFFSVIGASFLILFFLFRISYLHPFFFLIGLDHGIALANPNDPDVFFSLGENSFGQGRTYDVLKAEKAYSKAVGLRPNFLEAHYQLGRVYFIQGRFHLALVEIMTVLRLDPEFKKAYYMYGLISGYQENYDEAIYGFSEFIKRDDFNWAGYNDLAWIHFRKGDYTKTRDTAREGLRRAETNPWLQNIYGAALMNLGEKEKAEEAFRIALREVGSMTPEQWGGAYPGNDPKTYTQGFGQMRAAIEYNLALLED
ncbi:MAG: tetratricopeptide repeat protein [Candidatus Moranbacteria bacterium]|jgi:tetratricopeptide (TPR) repeat protein|nr:tetratricopeptide repeat protein [Candidatus Moranbacteria bacterium]